MLVLTRKVGQQIKLGEEIVVSVIKVDRKTVRIGIEAPADVTILRAEVDARSRPEHGAVARLTEQIPGFGSAPGSGASRANRILIVDDSPTDREVYRRFLGQDRGHAYQIFEADSGEAGLDLIHRERPECVLLDYRLPDLDGVEFLEELRKQSGEHPPVVMLTRFGSESVAVQALKRGAFDYLSKGSLTEELLCQTVIEVLDKAAGQKRDASA